MRLYNSLTGQKDILEKPKKGALRFFVCGPTVYDYSHIGHARTYIAFDILVRYLRSKKWKVAYLQNITDVDDKIIDRARTLNENPIQYAHKYEAIYKKDMEQIGCTAVSRYARATEHIPYIIKQIQALIKNGNAYEIPGEGYYFNISSFAEYGKLSGRTAAQAEDSISRIDDQIKKKNKGDFALWKAVFTPEKDKKKKFAIVNGEPAWNTPLGWGRPGWHIEDTAITEKWFGPQYDVHGGGIDLKFPHHEAEIAQQECASGKKPFVKIWLHAGSLRINGQKMSKSLKNFLTLRDYLKTNNVNTLRMIIAMHHYRTPVLWSEDVVAQAKQMIESFQSTANALAFIEQKNIKANAAIIKQFTDTELAFIKEFEDALDDDLNTPEAIAALFKFSTMIRSLGWKLSKSQAKKAQKTLARALAVLGITLSDYKIPATIVKFVEKRELCRSNKQFTHADALRNQIDSLGYIIEDTPIGPFTRKKFF